MQYYSAIEKNISNMMDLDIIILSEVIQKENYHMISLICKI